MAAVHGNLLGIILLSCCWTAPLVNKLKKGREPSSASYCVWRRPRIWAGKRMKVLHSRRWHEARCPRQPCYSQLHLKHTKRPYSTQNLKARACLSLCPLCAEGTLLAKLDVCRFRNQVSTYLSRSNSHQQKGPGFCPHSPAPLIDK